MVNKSVHSSYPARREYCCFYGRDTGQRPAAGGTSSYQGPGAAATAHRKLQSGMGLLLKQFFGRLTASNLVLQSSNGHLGDFSII